MNWLSQLSPDTVIPVLSLLASVGGWVWDRARGRETASFTSTIKSAVDNFIVELLDNAPSDDAVVMEGYVEKYMNRARDYIENRVWSALKKRGVPRNKLTERLLHESIEAGTARLGRELLERRKRLLEARQPTP